MGSGEFVNIHCIFKNFDADVNDPASYNFAATDGNSSAIMLTSYGSECESAELSVNGALGPCRFSVALLDEEHSLDEILSFVASDTQKLTLSIPKNSVTLVKIEKL